MSTSFLLIVWSSYLWSGLREIFDEGYCGWVDREKKGSWLVRWTRHSQWRSGHGNLHSCYLYCFYWVSSTRRCVERKPSSTDRYRTLSGAFLISKFLHDWISVYSAVQVSKLYGNCSTPDYKNDLSLWEPGPLKVTSINLYITPAELHQSFLMPDSSVPLFSLDVILANQPWSIL